MEQYVFNKITGNAALQTLLSNGEGGYNLFPGVIARGVVFTKAMTFTKIVSTDVFPNAQSVSVQFNCFATKHADVCAMTAALKALFHQIENDSVVGVGTFVVYAQRKSESDIGQNLDNNLFQREATYYFKLR